MRMTIGWVSVAFIVITYFSVMVNALTDPDLNNNINDVTHVVEE